MINEQIDARKDLAEDGKARALKHDPQVEMRFRWAVVVAGLMIIAYYAYDVFGG